MRGVPDSSLETSLGIQLNHVTVRVETSGVKLGSSRLGFPGCAVVELAFLYVLGRRVSPTSVCHGSKQSNYLCREQDRANKRVKEKR